MRWTKNWGLKTKMAAIFLSVTIFTGLCGLLGVLYVSFVVHQATTSFNNHEAPLLASVSKSILSLYRLRADNDIYQTIWDPQALDQQDAKIKQSWRDLERSLKDVAQEVEEMGQIGGNVALRPLKETAAKANKLALRYRDEEQQLHSIHHLLGQFMTRSKPDEPYTPVYFFLNKVSIAHLRWLNELKVAVENNFPFQGQTDPRLCQYGRWYYNIKTTDPKLLSILQKAEKAHHEMHVIAGRINELLKKNQDNQGMRRDFKKGSGDLDILRNQNRAEEFSAVLMRLLRKAEAYSEEHYLALSSQRKQLGDKSLATVQEFTAVMQQVSETTQQLINAATARLHKMMKGAILTTGFIILAVVLISLLVGRIFAVNLLGVIRLTSRNLEKTANKDLTDQLPREVLDRGDEIGQMARDVQKMTDTLATTVNEVTAASQSVASSSSQISQGNQELNERTQQQASAVEETASALEEMTSAVKMNATNALQANEMAREASQIADQGEEVLHQTVDAMKEVTKSSARIADIIGVVNDIAFQTNLLALNAAVEAARAGEAGRGFAVVAGEVRNLAQRSAQAAKEIQALISESSDKVEQGGDLVEQSGRILRDIIVRVQKMADTMGEISAANTEQARGIDEINRAMAQMDQVAQQNAALVEEAASASESMAAVAEQLRSQVSQFLLPEAETGRREPADEFQWKNRQVKSPAKGADARRPAKGEDFFTPDNLKDFEEF